MASSTRTISLKRETTIVPITALAFSGSYLLAAKDSSVLVYHVHTNKLIKTLSPRIFTTTNAGQPIHGIEVYPDGKVLLWGANAICVLVDGWDGEREVGGVADDWVYAAGLWPEEGEEGKGVVTTAHNDVFEFTYSSKQTTEDEMVRGLKFGTPISPSRPILYSATLTYLTPTTVLIAAGTVFGEIIVWKCHLDTKTCKTLYVLTGHEGSIFGVDISPPRQGNNNNNDTQRKQRILASCSDDRTVRLWEIETDSDEGFGGVGEEEMRAVRETGFNSVPAAAQEVRKGLKPLAVVMGHASRIWGVKMVTKGNDDNDEKMVVYSFGEDATMQRWGVDLRKGRMEHEETFGLHDGKHLWAHALTESESGGLLIGIGGGDGKISLIEEMGVGAQRKGMNSIDIKDVLLASATEVSGQQTKKPSKRSKEIITRYDFLTEDEVLGMTSSGRILRGRIDQKAEEWKVEEVKEDFVEDLGLCYAMRRVGAGCVVLGTTSGNVYLYRLGEGLSLVCEVPGRIMDLISVQGPYYTTLLDDAQGEMNVYVQLQGNMSPYYLTIDSSNGALVRKQELGQIDDRFVGVSALKARGYTLLGSRHGWIAILKAKDDGSLEYLTSIRATTQDAITSIIEVPPKSPLPEEPFYFLTTSRDGFYRIYQLLHPVADSIPRLDLLHETTALYGPTIETATFTPSSSSSSSSQPHLILSGFRSKSFVIWNETTRSELASVECGGAHRMHCLYTSPLNPAKLRFVFTKVSQVFIYAQERMGYRSLGTGGWHGREVKAVAVSEGSHERIATGGEDTTIRLWEYEESEGDGKEEKKEEEGKEERGKKEMRLMGSIKSHVTGLQRLKWHGDEYLLSSAGFEEFNVWKVRKLDAAYNPFAIVNKGILDDKSPLGDLRIMDFDVFSPHSTTTTEHLIISLIFSNSILKTYRFSEVTGFTPLVQGFYTGACLLQVRHLRAAGEEQQQQQGQRQLRILTGSTDGSLCIWKGNLPQDDQTNDVGEWVLESSQVVHQSGIKALDMVEVEDGYLVFTGGDDNSVNVTHITPSSSESGDEETGYKITPGAKTKSAHAASINGVAIIRKEGKGAYGVSVSNDQRMKLWDLNHGEEGRKVRLLKDEYSGVADPGDVDLLQGGRVMLAGVGLEVWDLRV